MVRLLYDIGRSHWLHLTSSFAMYDGVSTACCTGVKSGSVAVFRFDDDDSKWSPLTTMAASDGSSSDKYGASVAIHGTTIVVGTELADGYDYNSGAVYAYTTIPAYAYFTDESLSTAAVSLLTVGAFILSASVVLWVYKSGRLNSVLERDCYFGSVGHSDFDASRRGDVSAPNVIAVIIVISSPQHQHRCQLMDDELLYLAFSQYSSVSCVCISV